MMGWVCEVPNTLWQSKTRHASMMSPKDGSVICDDELQTWLESKGEEYDTWIMSCQTTTTVPTGSRTGYTVLVSIWFKNEMDALEFKLMWQ